MKSFKQTLRTYILGFLLSIALTFIAYFIVIYHTNQIHGSSQNILLIGVLIAIALIQLFVQLVFFLHLGEESSPKWNVVFFISTFASILIVIAASIWIMNHLNYNMTSQQMNQYIQDQSTF